MVEGAVVEEMVVEGPVVVGKLKEWLKDSLIKNSNGRVNSRKRD